jgi:two-component system, OmpR family, phosphate regulon sensor histidine kinase PhoR
MLPTVFFLFYQVGTLRQNEQVIESIYNNQLDAILFSINQYSEDALSSWANQFSGIFSEQAITVKPKLESLISNFTAINMLIQYDVNKKIDRKSHV